MTITMDFRGAAKKLDDIDLPKLGKLIGVGEDELHAFLDVETRGHGFDETGRPLILFEPHILYKLLSGPQLLQAIQQGLAYKSYGEKPYPRDSYPRLIAACKINAAAAMKATSWGLGQVLGANHKAAGYATVEEFVEAMLADEENHLKASINFIIAKGLAQYLRARNWDKFAAGYNGSSYKKNRYAEKMADSFAKWSRIKDTPIG